LLAILTPLFSALGEFLTARQCGVLQLECRLLHRQGQTTRCVLNLAAACANGPHLAALFSERLSTLCLPAPVRACELRADELVPHLPDSHSLWQPGEHGGDAAAVTEGLIERLRARLGPEAVHGLALCEGHRPEKAWAVSTAPIAGQRRTSGNNSDRVEALPPRRPLWLLREPESLIVQDGLPCRCGPLRLVSEPERIESGWWDGEEVAR